MSKTIKYLLAGLAALVALLVFIGNRSCKLYDENSILKGNEEVLVAQLDTAVNSLFTYQRENVALLTQLKIQGKMLTTVITKANNAAELMVSGFRTAEHLKANAENDKALIVEMEMEIGKRDELIEKLFNTVKKQEERYFTLTETYRITKRELDLSEIAIEQFRETIAIKDLRIKGLEKSLKGIRFSSGIKTPVIVGLAAVVIYGLVTK